MRKLYGNAVVEPSADVGALPDLRWIDKKLIEVDRRYQREISVHGVRHVNGILRDFQWQYFQVITVTPGKNGKFWAIDGQHRWLAAMRHPKVDKVPCVVIGAIDMQQQARVFEALNGKRLAITALQRFHVGVAAGDPVSMRIDYICSEAGITILKTVPQAATGLPPRALVSVGTVAKFLKKHSDPLLIAALSAMTEAWPDRTNGFRAANVAASIYCAVDVGPAFSRETMVRLLRGWNEHEEFLRAYTERSERGGILEKLLARRMVDRYRQLPPLKSAA